MVLSSLSTVMTAPVSIQPVSIQIGSECSDRKAATRRIEPFRAITWGCWCKAWTSTAFAGAVLSTNFHFGGTHYHFYYHSGSSISQLQALALGPPMGLLNRLLTSSLCSRNIFCRLCQNGEASRHEEKGGDDIPSPPLR